MPYNPEASAVYIIPTNLKSLNPKPQALTPVPPKKEPLKEPLQELL